MLYAWNSNGGSSGFTSASTVDAKQHDGVHVRLDISQFNAITGVTDFDPMTDRVRWDFGDGNGSQMPGFNAAYVYSTTGTKTITVSVDHLDQTTGNITTYTDTVSVSVASESSSVTIVDGLNGNAVDGDVAPEIAWAVSNYKTLVFNAGTTYVIKSLINLSNTSDIRFTSSNPSSSTPPSIIQAGSGEPGFFTINTSTRNLTFTGLRFGAPSGASVSSYSRLFRGNHFNNLTLKDCVLAGVASVIEQDASQHANGLLLDGVSTESDSSIERYLLYLGTANIANGTYSNIVVKNTTVTNVGGESVLRFHNGSRYVNVFNNNLEDRGGGAGGLKSALRVCEGQYFWVSGNTVKSGEEWLGPLDGADGFDDAPNAQVLDVVIENNTFESPLYLRIGAKRSVVRNNIFDATDGNSGRILINQVSTQVGGQEFPLTGGDYADTYRSIVKVAVVNNTHVTDSTSAAAFIGSTLERVATNPWDGEVRMKNLTFSNNLRVGPATSNVSLSYGNDSHFTTVTDNVWATNGSTAFRYNPTNVHGSTTSVALDSPVNTNWRAVFNPGSTALRDEHVSVALDSQYEPTTAGADVAARSIYALYDRTGTLRPTSSATAGAVQRDSDLPEAPTVSIGTTTFNSVTVNWVANSSNHTGFDVYRKTGSGSFVLVAGDLSPSSTSYVDNSVSAQTTYTYRVVAENSAGTAQDEEPVTTPAEPTTAVTAIASGDTYVRGGSYAGNNYGTAGTLEVKGATGDWERNAYFKFDISDLRGRTNLTQIVVRIYGDSQKTNTEIIPVDVFGVDNAPSWNETTVDWDDQPSPTGTALARWQVNQTAKWYQADITLFVQGELLAGKTSVTLCLKGVMPTDAYATFQSREAASSGDRPYLYASVSTPTYPPTPPSNADAVAGSSTSITVSWDDNSSSELGFKVHRRVGTGAWFEVADVGNNVTSWIDNTVSGGTTYEYQVFAYSAIGTSPGSNVATAQTIDAPLAPTVTIGTTTFNSVTVNWTANSSNHTGFDLYRQTGSGSFVLVEADLSPSTISYVDNSVSAQTSYTYRVVAKNSAGTAQDDEPVTTPAEPTTAVTTISSADTYVRGGSYAGNNYGSASTLEVKGTPGDFERNAYFKFDISNLRGRTNLTQIVVRIYGDSQKVNTEIIPVDVYGVADAPSWNESTVDWDDQPSPTGPALTRWQVNQTAKWYQADITAFVQSELLAGRTSVTLCLKGVMPTDANATFQSLEAANSLERPYLYASVSTPTYPPTPPSNAAAVANSATSITVSWDDNSSSELGFKVHRRVGTGAWFEVADVGNNVTSWIDNTVSSGTTYQYQVFAYSAIGTSPGTNIATA